MTRTHLDTLMQEYRSMSLASIGYSQTTNVDGFTTKYRIVDNRSDYYGHWHSNINNIGFRSMNDCSSAIGIRVNQPEPCKNSDLLEILES